MKVFMCWGTLTWGSTFCLIPNFCLIVPGLDHAGYLKLLLLGCGIPALGWLLAFISVFLVAVILDLFNSSMTWFTRPYLIFSLYYCPVLVCCMLFPVLLQNCMTEEVSLSFHQAFLCYYQDIQLSLLLLLHLCNQIRRQIIVCCTERNRALRLWWYEFTSTWTCHALQS